MAGAFPWETWWERNTDGDWFMEIIHVGGRSLTLTADKHNYSAELSGEDEPLCWGRSLGSSDERARMNGRSKLAEWFENVPKVWVVRDDPRECSEPIIDVYKDLGDALRRAYELFKKANTKHDEELYKDPDEFWPETLEQFANNNVNTLRHRYYGVELALLR